MNLQTILFFSSEPLNSSSHDLSENLNRIDVDAIWNPDSEQLPPINNQTALVVSDTMEGVRFAIANHIPYIEKWNDQLQDNSIQKPVCYYDDISNLHLPYLINQWKRAHHIPLKIASTTHLVLKELSLEDYPKLYDIRSLPSMAKTLPTMESLAIELDKHRNYITYQYEFFDYGLWGVFEKDGTLIGQAGIQNCEYQNETWLELSYLISPKYQRKGYATEAILSVYEYAARELDQNRMLAIIANNNLASIKTAMNLGMKKREAVTHLGFSCHYYVIDNLTGFLTCYKSEQKRANAAKSAYKKAFSHPVQEVYSRYRK